MVFRRKPIRRMLGERRTLILREPLVKMFGLNPPSMIVKKARLKGTRVEKEVDAWFDTATYYGALTSTLAKEIGVREIGKRTVYSPLLTEAVEVDIVEADAIFVDGKRVDHPRFSVVKRLPAGVDIIVGNEVMQSNEVHLVPRAEMMIVRNPNELWNYTTW